jgi:bifunctional DNA-binding transcriptional regulator/antitoxin component of YhaV-PrlF toxin-antitoxin module
MSSKDAMTRIVQPLRSGQITIPAEFRRRLGITQDTMLRMTLEDEELRISPLRTTETVSGSPWFVALYNEFAPVREEAARYSEEEIDAAIDEAVVAVRNKHARRT